MNTRRVSDIRSTIKRRIQDHLMKSGGLDFRFLKYELYDSGVERGLTNEVLQITPFPYREKRAVVFPGDFLEKLDNLIIDKLKENK